MDSFLHQMTADLALSDHGTFTQDFRSAARKKTDLARQEPTLMLGRLLQVAVAWNARAVRFIIEENDLEVRIQHSGTPPLPIMEEYLKDAFMLAAALEPADTRWTNGEGEARYRYYERRLGFWESLRRGLTRRTRHHSWLFERCRFAPIPVYLDGCRLNDPGPIQGTLQVMEVVPASQLPRQRLVAPSPRGLCSALTHLAGQKYAGTLSFGGGSNTLWLEGPKKVKVEKHDAIGPGPDYVTLVNECEDRGEQGWKTVRQWDWMEATNYRSPATTPTTSPLHMVARYWLSYDPRATYPAVLHPVRDGLLLEPLTLDSLPKGTTLVLSTPDLGLDLEGRRVIQDEAFQALLNPIRKRFEEILKSHQPIS